MKKDNFVIILLILFVSTITIISCNSNQQHSNESQTEISDSKSESLIKHGEYLVTIMGCNDCHSPKKMGPNGPEIIPELMLSGFPSDRPVLDFKDPLIQEGFAMFYPDLTAAAGPWGISFAGNLTPDETGIGNWTEDQFKKAFIEGKYKGLDNGRMLLPPMPVVNFKDMKEEDIKAIFTYLKSITPVKNIVPTAVSPGGM